MNTNYNKQIAAGLKGLGTIPTGTYTNDEKIRLLSEYQEALAEDVAGRGHDGGNRAREIRNSIDAMASRYGLTDLPALKRLRDGLEDLGQAIGGLIKGQQGERRLRDALMTLTIDGETKVLTNITLDDGRSCTEYDAIVLSRTCGIVVIEAKNYSFPTVINDRGYLVSVDRGEVVNEISRCMMRKRYLLHMTLNLSPGTAYHEFIVNASERATITDECGFAVCHVSHIVENIQALAKDEALLSGDQIRDYAEMLTNADMPRKGSCSVDCDQITRDYITVMVAINDAEAEQEAQEMRKAEEAQAERVAPAKPQPRRSKSSGMSHAVSFGAGALASALLMAIIRRL